MAEPRPTIPETGPYDCTACGACCTAEVYGGGLFVTLYGEDAWRFRAEEMAPDSPGCDFLLTTPHAPGETRCIFLGGTLGEACRCTAYDRRPQVCREFEAGSPSCLAARAQKFPGGDQPAIDLAQGHPIGLGHRSA